MYVLCKLILGLYAIWGYKMKILSCERKTGSFTNPDTKQNINYDNYLFTCLANDQSNMLFGQRYETIKVSVQTFANLCKYNVTDLAGHDVIFESVNNKITGIYLLK